MPRWSASISSSSRSREGVANQRNRSVDIVISDRDAAALMSDADYCKRLSAVYRRYRNFQADAEVADAMGKCESTDAAMAIPVLEKALTEMKIALPSRMASR